MKTHKLINLKDFLKFVITSQKKYWSLDDSLNEPDISARRIDEISKNKQYIAEELIRFLFNREIIIEILDNKLLGKNGKNKGK